VKKVAALIASLVLALLAAGCGSSGSPADYPKDFKVEAGDGAVIITWTEEPDVVYWLFWGRGPNITTTNWTTSFGTAVPEVKSPRVIPGLNNGADRSQSKLTNGDAGTSSSRLVAHPILCFGRKSPDISQPSHQWPRRAETRRHRSTAADRRRPVSELCGPAPPRRHIDSPCWVPDTEEKAPRPTWTKIRVRAWGRRVGPLGFSCRGFDGGSCGRKAHISLTRRVGGGFFVKFE
jgi:hypothetical protein